MVVGSSSSSRPHVVDRFYSPPAVRRQLEQQQMLHQRTNSPPPSNSPASFPVVESASGNLDRFLESMTPVVPAQYRHKMNPYFELSDLWEWFREWSAYGAGVPLVLDGNDMVVQYYVPYLSGIQLYVDSPPRHVSSSSNLCTRPDDGSDGDTYQETISGTSNSTTSQIRNFDVSGEACSQSKKPIFEHLERDSPYTREPLSDKISALASKFPALMTYKSCDLLPSSWISVAWYPIYRIPTGHTLRDLDACFLTFHKLSTPSNNISSRQSLNNGGPSNGISQVPRKLPLRAFGLASYKLHGSIWTSSSEHEQQLASSLLQAADDWLRFLQVDHPDFSFFFSRYNAMLR